MLHARTRGRLSAADFTQRAQARADEVADVEGLLMEHASPALPAAEQRALARRIAVASLGDLHLWEDLGLASRAELGTLMQRHFPALVAANAQGMRWKKFIHRALCLRAEILICRSPTCAACDEQAVCFGPEEAHALPAPAATPVPVPPGRAAPAPVAVHRRRA